MYVIQLLTESCPFQNSYAESLNLSVTEFGYRAFKEVIKVKRGHKGGALMQQDPKRALIQ